MGKPSAPEAPDPVETSAASTGTNVSTALANTFLQNVNQYGPDGSKLEYDVIDHYTFKDPYTGEKYEIPMFSATTTLSNAEQGIYDTNQDTRANLANIGKDQTKFLRDYLGTPFDGSPDAVANYLYDLGSDRMDERFKSRRQGLKSDLANQGLTPGSEAWNAQIGSLNEAENDAYNQLMLQGYDQAWNQMMAERAQPLNEIIGLMSGSQIALPNFNMNTPSMIPTTDNAQIINDIYQGELNAYQTQMSGYNNMMSGMFGLFGSILSDRRLKRDISVIGEANGLPVYRYRYNWAPDWRTGFMAQDVAAKYPQAVTSIGGYLTIQHDQIPEVA